MSNKNQTKVTKGREKACDGELKNTHKTVYLTQNSVIKKKYNDSST